MALKPGPHLAVAVFCETVLEDKTGVLSLIRIIDRITIQARGPEVPSQMPGQILNLTLVVCLKSGDAKGRNDLVVWPELPSGERIPKSKIPVLFEGEGDRGLNAIFRLVLPINQEGVYWFDVMLNEDQILTRVPLRILYQPLGLAMQP